MDGSFKLSKITARRDPDQKAAGVGALIEVEMLVGHQSSAEEIAEVKYKDMNANDIRLPFVSWEALPAIWVSRSSVTRNRNVGG